MGLMRFVFLVCASLMVGSCANVLRDFPNKSSDDYYLDLAKQHLNNLEFDEAIARVTPLLATRSDEEEVIKLAAEAYAGRAGLRTFDFILELSSGEENFFTLFAQHFPLADEDDVTDIETAIGLIEGFEDDPTQRSAQLNVLSMFLYYSHIGVVLNYRGFDTTNSRATGFDACDTNDLPEGDNQDIVRALPKAIDSASSLDDAASDLFSAFAANPALAAFLSSQSAECPGTVAADITACAGMRALINEGSAGIGIGAGAVTPCP